MERATNVAGVELAPAGQLVPVTGRSWRRGFANMLRKESQVWWGGGRWLAQALIWLVLINGLIAFLIMVMSLAPAEPGSPQITPELIYQTLVVSLFQLGLVSTSIGVVVTVQGAIIGEKQTGTAAWILSKPVSRPAFVLAKLLAQAISFITLAVLLPGAVGYAEALLLAGRAPALPMYIAGVGVWALNVLFYVAFTLMLGTLFNSRGAVAGIALAFMFGGSIVSSIVPNLAVVTPWVLPNIASALGTGQPVPETIVIPLVLSVFWTVLCAGVAVWRFGREEF
jgi:ABC-2 type transport system permease protein